MAGILTKREREFILDWLRVLDGEMEKAEFYLKWGTKRDGKTILEDYRKVARGEMSMEEFREKWGDRGEWKTYVRVMKHRIEKKRRNLKKIVKELQEDIKLINEFARAIEWP